MTGTDRPGRIAEPWGARTPYGPGGPWPERVDVHLADGVDPDAVTWVRSASVLHSNGDALDHAVLDGRVVGVRGRADDRVNRGRLGPKDLYGWQGVQHPDRLTRPLVREGGRLVETDWDTAMGRIVERTRRLLDERGPSSIGFYTTGQLFAEEYWTLAAIGHGAIGTNHVDGNTRLCTATAAAALKASFGADGQPGSYGDVDHADVIALFGHNVAATQTVLWSRMLDRLAGDDPPRLLCVDPRDTPVARAARDSGGAHLAPRPGTNVALMNGLLHAVPAAGGVDRTYVDAHTVGFDALEAHLADLTPEWAAPLCGVPASDIRAAADLLCSARALLSTVLQGFYQSHQATAAAVQVNNLHLLRGILGRPGCGVLQMNGQPSAENTRECGADGDLAGFRNWANPAHVAELAAHWNLDPDAIPHATPPTHTAATSSPARRTARRPTGRPTPGAGRCCTPPSTCPPTSAPAARTRSRWSRAGRWCTSTPGRRPGAPRSCRRPSRRCGSSAPAPTPSASAWGASTALGRRRAVGALLLADLRALHLRATGVADDWEVLEQAASTMRDAGLRELVGSCRPRAERIAHWADTQLAEQAPQVVAS